MRRSSLLLAGMVARAALATPARKALTRLAGVVGFSVVAHVGVACSSELPDCPPGVNFEDCKPGPISNTPALGPRAMGGSGGGEAVAASGAGGNIDSGGSAGSEGSSLSEGDELGGAGGAEAPPAVDNCPDDLNKTQPGTCGCGVPEDNFDGDGAADCVELCPDNAGKTLPSGACGCSALTDTAGCNGLRDALRNLYTFDDDGIEIIDSVGGMNGTLLDAAGLTPLPALEKFQLNGRLNLDGAGGFVELPPGLISSLTSATFEVWTAWRGGAAWARLFDFGSNDGVAGQTYLFLTPANGLTGTLRAAYSVAGPGAAETLVDGTAPLPIAGAASNTLQHLAVVVDQTAGFLRLYAGGALVSSVALPGNLAAISDLNNWLGRSNYNADPLLFGSLIEFRIYDQALSAAQISTSFQAGPGALN
jgi:hypothetical protein